MDTFTNAPSWFQSALAELGTREEPENRGPAIRRYIQLAKCGAEGDPWCAIFVNAMLEMNGVPGTQSPSSQSFAHSGLFSNMGELPALGCIVVFYRGRRGSGLGHAGFYRGESDNYIYTLSGNEGDMVQIEPLPKETQSFGLVGYYWPKSVPMPPSARVIMPVNTPAHVVKVT